MTQRTHLDECLLGRIISRLNIVVPSWKYPRNLESPRVSSPDFGNEFKMMVMIARLRGCGGIFLGSRTNLRVQIGTMTVQIYQDVILNMYVHFGVPWAQQKFVLMDDNACPHPANIVSECLQSKDITHMDWAAFSPDLNPVEHVWDMLGR
ncbi:transposable element Tcb2 transposase [Trichonephila clavipes]|nr:transposable element Tcb2 transposase [Trichonephila clavipes]